MKAAALIHALDAQRDGELQQILVHTGPVTRSIPDLWDGHAGEGIAGVLHQTFA